MPDTVSVTAVDAGLTDVAGTSVNRHCVLELAAPNAAVAGMASRLVRCEEHRRVSSL
jgi:hypothetical protein